MILFGTNGHGKVVYDALKRQAPLFFDDNESILVFLDKKVARYHRDILPEEKVLITIGNNKIRFSVAKKLQHSVGLLIADTACVSSMSEILEGSQILQGTVIQAGVKIGKHVIVNTGASVDHDCEIDDFCHIAPQATLCGNVRVGEGTMIGAGTTIIPGISIGKWCTIGAGSVVINDIPDHATVVGNPARIIKINE